MRGSGGSFGITTSIAFSTHPVPPAGLVFTYQWLLNVSEATQALSSFQSFCLSADFPPALGPMLYFFPGAPKGSVLFGLTGGWYGDISQINATLEPFLSQMSIEPVNVVMQSGTFVESLQFPGAGFALNLNTSQAPDTNDTFYAKSVMTPLMDKEVPEAAWEGLMSYLANEGNETSLVSSHLPHILFMKFVTLHRGGQSKSKYGVELIPLLALSLWTIRLLHTVVRCSRSSCTSHRRIKNLLILKRDSILPMVGIHSTFL
jgi:hypothetical protein